MKNNVSADPATGSGTPAPAGRTGAVRVALILSVLLCLFAPRALAELKAPQELRPFQTERIVFTAPGEGALSLWIEREGYSHPILEDASVAPGENVFEYDALGHAGQPLGKGFYTLRWVFSETDAPKTLPEDSNENRLALRVREPVPALLYALSAAEDAFEGEPFEVDYCLSAAGRLQVVLLDGRGKALADWKVKVANDKPRMFRWDGKLGGSPAKPGDYVLSFQVEGAPQPARLVPFTLRPGARPQLPVAVTEVFLPETPEDVAAALAAPLVVVDVGPLTRQSLFQQPSTKSRPVGSVYGQTVGLRVIRIEGSFAYVGAWRRQDGDYVEGYVPLEKLKTVTPHPGYALVIDKVGQTMTVYLDGKVLGTHRVSTGQMYRHETFRETRAGTFIVGKRIHAYTADGMRYDYCFSFDGGNLVHQAGYRDRPEGPDFSAQLPRIGSKASHGCVRVEPYTEYSAFWLWTHLPRGSKILILDDPLQREQRMAELYPYRQNAATP